jgi:hypothetical protein
LIKYQTGAGNLNKFLQCIDSLGSAAWMPIPGGVTSVLPGSFGSISVTPGTGIGNVTLEATGVFGNLSNPTDIKTYGGVKLLGAGQLQIVTGAAAGKVLHSDASGNASWETPEQEGVATLSQDGTYNNIVLSGTGSGGGPYTGDVSLYCTPQFDGLALAAGTGTFGGPVTITGAGLTCTTIQCTQIQCNGPINPFSPGGTVFGTTVSGGVSGPNPAFQAFNTVLAQDQTINTHLTGGASTGYVVTDAEFCPQITGGLLWSSINRGVCIETGVYGGALFPGFQTGGTALNYCSFPMLLQSNHVMAPGELVTTVIFYNPGDGKSNSDWTLPNASQVHTFIQQFGAPKNPNQGNDPFRVGLYWYWTVYNLTGGAVFIQPLSLDGTCALGPVFPSGPTNCRAQTTSDFLVQVTKVGGGVAPAPKCMGRCVLMKKIIDNKTFCYTWRSRIY